MAEQVLPPVELINYELTSAAIAAEASRADAILPSVSARIAELQRMGLIGQFYVLGSTIPAAGGEDIEQEIEVALFTSEGLGVLYRGVDDLPRKGTPEPEYAELVRYFCPLERATSVEKAFILRDLEGLLAEAGERSHGSLQYLFTLPASAVAARTTDGADNGADKVRVVRAAKQLQPEVIRLYTAIKNNTDRCLTQLEIAKELTKGNTRAANTLLRTLRRYRNDGRLPG